jgi:hypothetical protein
MRPAAQPAARLAPLAAYPLLQILSCFSRLHPCNQRFAADSDPTPPPHTPTSFQT